MHKRTLYNKAALCFSKPLTQFDLILGDKDNESSNDFLVEHLKDFIFLITLSLNNRKVFTLEKFDRMLDSCTTTITSLFINLDF